MMPEAVLIAFFEALKEWAVTTRVLSEGQTPEQRARAWELWIKPAEQIGKAAEEFVGWLKMIGKPSG